MYVRGFFAPTGIVFNFQDTDIWVSSYYDQNVKGAGSFAMKSRFGETGSGILKNIKF